MRNQLNTAVSLTALAAALAFGNTAAAADAKPGDQVEEVIVTAQQARKQTVADGNVGVLGAKDALSIPFNLTTFTSKLILDQQSETIGAVMLNDPSVRTTFGGGNQSEQFVIRGFALFGDDISFDGLFGVVPRQLVSPELFESVQVLNGASAFLYGATPGGSGVGGGIDLTPKRATGRLLRVTGDYIRQGILGGALDAGLRFGPNDEFGVRVNSVYRKGESEIHGEHREVRADSLDLDWGHGPVHVYADLGYEDQRADASRPEVKLAAGIAVPSAPSARANFAQPWSFTHLVDHYGVIRTEVDLAKDIQAYVALGARRGTEEGDYSTLTVTNATTGGATQSRLYVPRNDHNESGILGVRAKLDTGPLTHEISAGYSEVTEANRNSFTFGTFPAAVAASTTAFFTNLYSPVIVARPVNSTLPASGGSLTDPPRVARTLFASSFASDTIGAFDGRALLTVGLRRQNIVVKSYSRATLAQTTEYDKSATTPVIGLVVKPTEHLSVYANRIEALVQGPVAPLTATTSNPGEVFAPFTSVQYEAGAKLAYNGLTSTVAIYQIKQPSAFATPVPGSATLTHFGVDGLQKNRGVEVTLNGEPTDWLRIIGGFSINDAKLSKTLNGTNNGKKAIGVPDFQASLGFEINPPMLRNLTLTGRVLNTGSQYVDIVNTQKISSSTRFDLGARYVAVFDEHPVTFRLSAENIANKGYWASAFGGYLVMGEPRTIKASATFEY